MKKQLNYKLLAILLAALGVGVGAAFLLHFWQMGRHARTLMAEARAAETEGRLDLAARSLQRYLVFAPEDNAARARYGEMMEQVATSDHERWRAVTVYEQVLYREPSRRDIRRRLALLTLRLNWVNEAQTHLEILIRDHGQSDLVSLLGHCQEDAGDYSAAAASYESALRENPHQVDAYVRLAHLCQHRLDQPEKASRLLNELVQNNDQSAEAYLARALHHMNSGSLEDAGRDMDRACELAPDEPRVLLPAADLARRRGRLEVSYRCLRHGLERDPRNLAMQLALATLELGCDRKTAAIACLQRGLQALPNQPDLLHLLVETHLLRGDERAAEDAIERLHRPGSPPGLGHYLDGRLQMSRRQWPRAIRTLEEVVQLPDRAAALASRASLALAQCHEQTGDHDRQRNALRAAVALDASSSSARLTLAAALRDAGQIDEALEQYRELVQLPQAPDESWLLLSRLLVQRNRSLPAHKRRWTEVERLLQRAERLPALEVPLTILRADVLVERGRSRQAQTLLEQATTDHPEEADLWTALADLALRQGEPTRSAQILEEARCWLGEGTELSEAEVALGALHRPLQARRALRKLEKELNHLSASEQVRLLGEMAATYFQLGEQEEGRRLCRLLAGRAPMDLHTRLLLLDLAVQGGDDTLLAGLVADVRRLEGEEGTWWRYGEASRLLLRARRGDRRGLNQAKELLADIARRRPGWSRGALLEGYLHELTAESAAAADAYLRAFRSGERRARLAEHLVRLLTEQGRLDEVDEVIRGFQQQQALLSPELARLGAEIALRQHGNERAVELARLAVPADSSDYLKLIWLGQMLALAAQPSEAEEVLRRAIQRRGDLAETWLALIAHLTRIDHLREAEEVRDEMRRHLPADQVPLALAICAEVLGQLSSAERYYRQCLARTPDDDLVLQRAARFYLRLNRSEQAEPLLRRMLAADANVLATNQAWARRQLALLLAFGPLSAAGEGKERSGDAKYREALALLNENRRLKEDGVLDRRARLLVQAIRTEKRTATLQLLEKSGRGSPFTAEELVCLVQLYEANDEANMANERMLDLLALDRNNPAYLTHHIDRLLQRGRKDDVRPWIVRLQKLKEQ